ncbi:hypothetical protein [Sphingobium sufflavum]|uniref:hypothetical protein n=1 Tax=Sphingobium sufflavum TaxID=1129547 RepID=UPI001F3D7219|nr:hypothetical protein [Sphingobium sufflavum]
MDRSNVNEALKSIEDTQAATKQMLLYGSASSFILLWGILTSFGFIFEYFRPDDAGLSWFFIRTVGIVGGFLYATYLNRTKRPVADKGLLYAFLATGVLGWLWSFLIPVANSRALDAHWTLIFMLTLVVAGMWIGRTIIAIGLIVSALTIVGLLHAGAHFHLWMALCNGGGLIVASLWLRSKGLVRYVEE